jgi:hypothetical protein
MRILDAFLLLSFSALFFSVTVQAQNSQPKFSQPQPPKITAAPTLRLHPASEVPLNPEKIIWKVTNKVNGKGITTGPVRAYDFSGSKPSQIGTIQEGTVVTLDEVRLVGRTLYYSVGLEKVVGNAGGSDTPKPPTSAKRNKAWISGLYIAPAELAPTAQ